MEPWLYPCCPGKQAVNWHLSSFLKLLQNEQRPHLVFYFLIFLNFNFIIIQIIYVFISK